MLSLPFWPQCEWVLRLNESSFFKIFFAKNVTFLSNVFTGKGQFNSPTGVALIPNGDIAVADRKNKRVQVFEASGKFKYLFKTQEQPYTIATDSRSNIIVGSVKRSVEIYNGTGKFLKRWLVGPNTDSLSILQIAATDKNEVVISDTEDKKVKIFTYGGRLLHQFEPIGGESMAVHPSAVAINEEGQIVLADSLNHTVNLYSKGGALLNVIAGPVDDVGSVQTVALSSIGHLVVTEFTTNGPHCLKVFRYRDCECHRTRPGSSKRRTPTTPK